MTVKIQIAGVQKDGALRTADGWALTFSGGNRA
jgi:hypothetical protein